MGRETIEPMGRERGKERALVQGMKNFWLLGGEKKVNASGDDRHGEARKG